MNDLEDKFYLVINQMLEKTDMKVINVNINRKKIDYDIRLVIDSDRGVNIDDCAYVSRIAKDAINLEKIIATDFNLEVSSQNKFTVYSFSKNGFNFKLSTYFITNNYSA